jgi:hypothetical protein
VAPGGRGGAWPLAIFIPCVSISHLPVVDGVFWYTKHVHYTLVWTYYETNPPLGILMI